MKSIAFPTIGTAAKFGFPKDEVAKTLLHTIVEFMVEHSSCKLEEIGVVIDDDDLESTVVYRCLNLITLGVIEKQ